MGTSSDLIDEKFPDDSLSLHDIAGIILDKHAHELAEEIRELGRIWSSEDVMSAADAIDPKVKNPCPYTHAHTRHWCGYEQCRDS